MSTAPKQKPARRALLLLLVLLALFLAWLIPWVFTLHLGVLVYFPYKPDGKSRYVRVTGPVAGWFGASWTPRSRIPKAMFAAVIAAEDAKFYEHFGVDWESLRLSYNVNERVGRFKRGGSTITQQLVKNAFLSRRKSYVRKAREIVGALLLDLTMSKELQLTWYLNVVEFGPNVYGIGSAARHYFQKSAQDLRPSECIQLAVILPRPNRWNRSLLTRQYTSFFRNRYRIVYNRIRILGLLDERELRLTRKQTPFPVNLAPLPDELPLLEIEGPEAEDSPQGQDVHSPETPGGSPVSDEKTMDATSDAGISNK